MSRRRSRRIQLFAVLLSASAISRCATIGTIQTAETLGKDNYQFAIESSTWGGTRQKNPIPDSTTFAIPNANFAARYGIADSFDLGARIGSSGMEITTKLQLTDPKPKSGVVVSIAPSIGGWFVSDEGTTGSLYGQLPLLLGFRLGKAAELIFGPKVHDWMSFDSSAYSSKSSNLFSVGSSLGLSLSLGKKFLLLPEISVLYPVLGTVPGITGSSQYATPAAVLFQGTLAFLFGG